MSVVLDANFGKDRTLSIEKIQHLKAKMVEINKRKSQFEHYMCMVCLKAQHNRLFDIYQICFICTHEAFIRVGEYEMNEKVVDYLEAKRIASELEYEF